MLTRSVLALALLSLPLSILTVPTAQATDPGDDAPGESAADDNKAPDKKGKDSWTRLGADRNEAIEAFARDYMAYLDRARTELTAVAESTRLAGRHGFDTSDGDEDHDNDHAPAPRPGHGFVRANRGRALLLVRPGTEPIDHGLHIIATHIDSPRLDLKARPLYAKQAFALLQTQPHGGIKYYQWGNEPLALLGHVDTLEGKRVPIAVGLEPDDPVLLIPDLAPHVDKPRRERKSREVIVGEELDPIIGSKAGADGVKQQILALLAERYGITEDDFVSAELQLVPASRPREVGLDRGLILAYGQDDKLCSYTALRAILDEPRPAHWSVVYLTDNEESGSNNNTGARAEFIKTEVSAWLKATGGYDELRLRRVFERSVVLSGDVTTGINPLDPGVHEATNASVVNGGVVIKRYGKGNDANSEVVAQIRRLLAAEDLPWQTHTYKVDVGGGGTLGGFLSVMGMEVIDVGAPVLSMHSPAEVASKADVYALYLLMRAFLRQ